MCFLEFYFILGLIVVMFFEYLFETHGDVEMKYSGYGERLIFLLLWPIIVSFFLMSLIKGADH